MISMSKIIITGSCGFIGSSICDYFLEKKIKFLGIDNLSYGYKDYLYDENNNIKYDFLEKDICDENIIDYINKDDIIIHLAAISSLAENQSNPIKCYKNNVLGTINLLEAGRKKGISHFIFASTSAIYENATVFPCSENDNINDPYLLYSLSKFNCEQIINSYNKNYNLNYSIIRFFNVYGPKNDYFRKLPPLIPYVVNELYADRVPELHSDGEQKRDYLYIDDLIDLVMKILENKNHINNVFNASSNNIYSVNDIYNIISKKFNKNIVPIYKNPDKFWEKYTELYTGELRFNDEIIINEVNKFTLGDNKKGEELLGWKATTDIETGLQNIVEYYKKLMSQRNK